MKAIHARKLLRPIDATYTEMFSGKVYTVGKGAVSKRNHSAEAANTVIAIHGFLENHCYFSHAYQEPDTELILITCSNYHVPVSGPVPEPAPWQYPIKYLEDTIEYDACILNMAIQNLTTTRRIRVHGHSRGAAVALEAMRRHPELYENVDMVLEAPVLPNGNLHPLLNTLIDPISHGMWPFVVRLFNSTSASTYGHTFMGRLNGRKKTLLDRVFTTTKNHLTIVRNIENIKDWMEKTTSDIYKDMRHGTILIPRTDRIMDRETMLRSAEHSLNAIRIVETTADSHFVILESEEWVPPLNFVPQLDVAKG